MELLFKIIKRISLSLGILYGYNILLHSFNLLFIFVILLETFFKVVNTNFNKLFVR